MEYISLNNVKHTVLKYHTKNKNTRIKLNDYFNTFVDKHYDLDYIWDNNKIYIPSNMEWQIKKDLQKITNRTIRSLHKKKFEKTTINVISAKEIKEKIEEKRRLKKDAEQNRINSKLDELKKIKTEFKKGNIKTIGSFDLEFWEDDLNRILEIGFIIYDVDVSKDIKKQIVIQENLEYINSKYVQSNKFSTTSAKILPLHKALSELRKFCNSIDLLIGHGLDNDVSVLKSNGFGIEKTYVDTAELGAALEGIDGRINLKAMLEKYDIEHKNLHTALNDAEKTLELFLAFMEKKESKNGNR